MWENGAPWRGRHDNPAELCQPCAREAVRAEQGEDATATPQTRKAPRYATKPSLHTIEYYLWHELAGYVREANFKAIWILNKMEWDGDWSGRDLEDMASDIAEFPGSYHVGAVEQVAWMRAEFGDYIKVKQ